MSKRQCFWVFETSCDEHGYIPSMVTEGEPGHAPMRGDGTPGSSPWYWGKTIEEAKAIVDKQNRERFGIERQEALEIVLSSMAASNR